MEMFWWRAEWVENDSIRAVNHPWSSNLHFNYRLSLNEYGKVSSIGEYLIFELIWVELPHRWIFNLSHRLLSLRTVTSVRLDTTHVGTFNEKFLIQRLNESPNSIFPFNWLYNERAGSGHGNCFPSDLQALVISNHLPFSCCFCARGTDRESFDENKQFACFSLRRKGFNKLWMAEH